MAVKVYMGNSTWNQVILTMDGQKVYRGNSTWNEVVATVDGNQVYRPQVLLAGFLRLIQTAARSAAKVSTISDLEGKMLTRWLGAREI